MRFFAHSNSLLSGLVRFGSHWMNLMNLFRASQEPSRRPWPLKPRPLLKPQLRRSRRAAVRKAQVPLKTRLQQRSGSEMWFYLKVFWCCPIKTVIIETSSGNAVTSREITDASWTWKYIFDRFEYISDLCIKASSKSSCPGEGSSSGQCEQQQWRVFRWGTKGSTQ